MSEALIHAGAARRCRVKVVYVDSEDVVASTIAKLKQVDAVLIPGGFGVRGTEGMVAASQFAREQDIPFLGICLGL